MLRTAFLIRILIFADLCQRMFVNSHFQVQVLLLFIKPILFLSFSSKVQVNLNHCHHVKSQI